MPPRFKFTRDEISDAAFGIVRRRGWKALTTRSLAESLEASARPIYSFFKSMAALEDEIVKKAVDLLYHYMIQTRTGDPWHDHGIGYVLFAMEEKHLFRAVNDERHIQGFKTHGDVIWKILTDSLSDYPPFSGLTEEDIYQIQLNRWLFAHGLAFSASAPPPDTWNRDTIVLVMCQGSDAILKGMRQQFSLSNPPKGG